MLGENKVVSGIISVSAIIFGLAIFAVVMYFAVVVSKTYVTLFYFNIQIDYADIILAVITLFLALCLLVLIIIVGIKLRGGYNNNHKTFKFFFLILIVLQRFREANYIESDCSCGGDDGVAAHRSYRIHVDE